MRGSTKVLVISILLGVILLATSQAQTMDASEYRDWSTRINKISAALNLTGIVVLETKQLALIKRIFLKLSDVSFQLQSWANEVTPSSAGDFVYHAHLKNRLHYEHLANGF